ncbi:kinase-like domain-containing protein [Lyophyllum atratum]|nr:kinase-like domain-containing protein [Lyophyllum atratum]
MLAMAHTRTLDSPPPSFHSNLIVATQRLAGRSGLYPTCYELTDITAIESLPVHDGGFTDIYKGSFKGRPVCLKVVPKSDDASEARMQRWLKDCSKESILWGQLSHPNLLPFYGIYRLRGQIAFIAPWMEYGDVTEYLKKHPEANRVLLLLDITQGLQCLHTKGIIHGDLKGLNILVRESGTACVADFGLSAVSDRNILKWASQSSVASRGGTVRWQAPELLHPGSFDEMRNTKASDIYAWSCVAYEIFTGNIPYPHIPYNALISEEVRNGARPRRPSNSSNSWRAWGLTEDMWSLMQDCWKANRLNRPTVEDVVKRLSGMLSPAVIRPVEQDTMFSPAQFRQLTRQGSEHDELTVDVFESLLEASSASNPST